MLAVRMTVREATKDDAPLLTAIHRECFTNYWNVDSFNDFFAVGGTLALLASIPEPAGIIVYRVLHEDAEIITLAVRPGARRWGIGRALVTQAMAKTAAMGAKRMFLDVEEGNEPAFSLYRQYGFIEISRRKQYYKQKDGSFTDALVMACKFA